MRKILKKLKLNKKGYTLVEIIAAVVIVGILSCVAIFSGVSTMNKAHVDYCTSLSDNMVIAGRDYFHDNKLKLPTDYEKISCVTLQGLIACNYIEVMRDYDDNTCDSANSKVCSIKETNTTFFYNPVLSCYQCKTTNTSNLNAEVPTVNFTPNSATGSNKIINKDLNVTINMKGNPSGTKKVVSYNYQVYKLSNSSNDIKDGTMVMGSTDYKKYTSNPKVKLTETGKYKIVATAINEDARKRTETSGVYEIERTFPSSGNDCRNKAVSISVNWDANKWYKGTFTARFTKKGVVKSYDVYVETINCRGKETCTSSGQTWKSTRKINKATKNTTYNAASGDSALYRFKVIAYDEAGNNCKYTTTSEEYWQDNEKPTCPTSSYTSPNNYPTAFHNYWTNQTVKIKGTCKDTGGSGCSGDIETPFSDEMNGRVSPGKVKDKVGNESTNCPSLLVRIDKTKPSCDGISDQASTNDWKKKSDGPRLLGVKCKDTGSYKSECKESKFTKYSNLTEGRYETNFSIPIEDWAGNVNAECSKSYSFRKNLDFTDPECGAKIQESNWKASGSSTIGFKCKDPIGSNDAKSECVQSEYTKNVSSEGKADSVSFTIKDKAGNTATCEGNVNKLIDKTDPVININIPRSSCRYDNTWFNSDYSVTITAKDSSSGGDVAGRSGIKKLKVGNTTINCGGSNSCSYNYPVTQEGSNSVSVEACDMVNHCVNSSFTTKLDKTPPTSTINGISCDALGGGRNGWHGYITLSVRDSYSGPWIADWHVWNNADANQQDVLRFNGSNFSDRAGTGCTGPTWRDVEVGDCECTRWDDGECIRARREVKQIQAYTCSLTYSLTNFYDRACNQGQNNSGTKGPKKCDIDGTERTITRSCTY